MRWWQSPTTARRLSNRKLISSLAALALAIAAYVALASAWNYYDVSLPVTSPSSETTSENYLRAPRASPPSPVGSLQWEFYTGEPLAVPPVTVGGSIYLISGQTRETGRLTALRRDNGAVIWQIKLGSISDVPPVLAGQAIYVATRSGKLLSLDSRSGAEIWNFDLGSSAVGPPIVWNGALYAASDRVYALDAATGKGIWTHGVEAHVTRGLALSENVIAAVSSDGSVNLISALNGQRRLTFPLWFGSSRPPAVSRNILVTAGDRATVQAISMKVKDIPMEKAVRYWWTKLWLWEMAPPPPLPRGYIWQRRDIGGTGAYPVAADEDLVYIGIARDNLEGGLAALDIETGMTRWERDLDSLPTYHATLTEDAIIVASERGIVLMLDRFSGERLWEYDAGFGLASSPVPAGDLILFPSADGTLRAVR